MPLEPTIMQENKVIDQRYRRITTNGIQVTTKPNEEIIMNPLGLSKVLYRRVTVFVESDCTITRNGEEKIYMLAGGDLVLDVENTPTSSLVVEQVGIRYFGVADY